MIKFYHFFRTTFRDGSIYWGIRGNFDPMWDQRIDYIGDGPKLWAKLKQLGPNSFNTEVLHTSVSYEEVERMIKNILTPGTYADPRCLNVSPTETAAKIAEAHTGLKHEEITKHTIAASMMRNENALAHVVTEEAKEQISESRTKQKLKWIHNKTTREELQIPAEELADGGMLTGFTLGRLPKELKEQGPVPADTTKKYVDY